MSWNDSNNSGGKDPWGGRNNNSGGPPDLDEVVRKLQQQLKGLFGGGKGGDRGQGSEGGSGGGGKIIVIAAIAAALLWFLSGFYVVEEGQRGVVRQFGAYTTDTAPGLHWYARFIQTVDMVDIDSIRNISLGSSGSETQILTQDENIINVEFVVQYKIKEDGARDYLFNVRDPVTTLRELTSSAVREVIGKNKMDFVITDGREVVAMDAQRLLQEGLDEYGTGLQVKQLTMQKSAAPQQVQWAFDDVVKAREDEVRYTNQAETYSNNILPSARGEAARVLEQANAYKEKVIAEAEGETSRFLAMLAQYELAPEVTRKRLYLEAMESVLGKSSKVVVDSDGSNNLLYLPLDKLIQRSNSPLLDEAADVMNRYKSTDSSSRPSSADSSGSSRGRDNLRTREVR